MGKWHDTNPLLSTHTLQYNLSPSINAAICLFFRCIAGIFPYKPYYNKNDSVTNSFANRSAAPTKHRRYTLICRNTPCNSQVRLVDLKSSKFSCSLYLFHHDTYFLIQNQRSRAYALLLQPFSQSLPSPPLQFTLITGFKVLEINF